MIYEKLSPKQLELIFWWHRKKTKDFDAIICDGAVRSGKTMAMTVGFVLWSSTNFQGQNFAFCGKTISSLKRNVIEPMRKWLEGIAEIRSGGGQNFVDISAQNHVNRYYFFGGKDENSYKSIQGVTLAGVMLDEVALMPKNFVEQAISRCSVKESRFWLNCNPDSPEHWFYKEWILKTAEKNALRLKFTMNDNFSLSENVKNRYKRLYSGIFYDRYIMGNWISADGLVYDMFDKNINIIHKIPETEGDFYVSADFGIQNATVFLLWRREKSPKNRWICLDEWYYSGRESRRQKTVGELAGNLAEWLGDIQPRCVYIDPSASALIEECRRANFRVKSAKNNVLNGISDVSMLLADGRLVFSDKCEHTIREFSAYVWDETATRNGVDVPVKNNDHCLDAVRYFVNSLDIARKKYKFITKFVD